MNSLFKEHGMEYKNIHEPIKVILKKGVGHHPHSLEDPKEIVDFIQSNRNLQRREVV